MGKIQLCLICHKPVEKSWHLFCNRCLHMSIEELDQQYKERGLHSREEDQTPLADNPKEEAHLFKPITK